MCKVYILNYTHDVGFDFEKTYVVAVFIGKPTRKQLKHILFEGENALLPPKEMQAILNCLLGAFAEVYVNNTDDLLYFDIHHAYTD